MAAELEKRLDPALLDQVQIFASRVSEDLDPTRARVLWVHDTPDDPMYSHLENGGWKRFHRIVCVSNWQMQGLIGRYQIPWDRCIVLQNAIEPLPQHGKPVPEADGIKLIYTPTPHRGLNVLYAAFQELAKRHSDVHLDVYSSFALYGWSDRDAGYKQLFDLLEEHPQITNHGTVSNAEVRDALMQSHVFAYPSTWQETSCRCLMEAMSAGLLCVHSNLGALYETAANWTMMYQFQEDPPRHAAILLDALEVAVQRVRSGAVPDRTVKSYADLFYGWDVRAQEWTGMLTNLLDLPREIEKPTGPEFVYRVN